jgi:hypothetical protein
MSGTKTAIRDEGSLDEAGAARFAELLANDQRVEPTDWMPRLLACNRSGTGLLGRPA